MSDSRTIEHMLDRLAEAVSELEIPVDSTALRTAIALCDRLTAKITAAVGEFDAAGLWDVDCAPSMKSWLRDEGMPSADAHRTVLYGKRMRQLPVTSLLWQAGELSNGQARAIFENVIDRHVGKFQDVEADLVPSLVGLSVKDTLQVMGEWRARADAVDDDPPPDPERLLHISATMDDRHIVNGVLDGAGGDVVTTAIAVAASSDLSVPLGRRQADALVLIARFFLDHNRLAVAPRQRPHVSLLINAEDLGSFAEGQGFAVNPDTGRRYDAATVSRYLCDCAVSPVLAERVGGAVSRVLDLGRAQRTASVAQRNALGVRDRGCRFEGCDAPPGWCEAHHIEPWEQGGRTDLDNLALLCSQHHDLVHRKGIDLKLLADATLRATYRDGRTWTTHPPGTLTPLRDVA